MVMEKKREKGGSVAFSFFLVVVIMQAEGDRQG